MAAGTRSFGRTLSRSRDASGAGRAGGIGRGVDSTVSFPRGVGGRILRRRLGGDCPGTLEDKGSRREVAAGGDENDGMGSGGQIRYHGAKAPRRRLAGGCLHRPKADGRHRAKAFAADGHLRPGLPSGRAEPADLRRRLGSRSRGRCLPSGDRRSGEGSEEREGNERAAAATRLFSAVRAAGKVLGTVHIAFLTRGREVESSTRGAAGTRRSILSPWAVSFSLPW